MITIHQSIKYLLPDVRLAFLQGIVLNRKTFHLGQAIKNLLANDWLSLGRDVNESTRKAYKLLGKQPSRYRPSAEALRRRILKGNDILSIHNAVDIINYISIYSGFSISIFDYSKIQGPIIFNIGDKSNYNTIGRGIMNIEKLPCLYDNIGPFGNPCSDSYRTSIEHFSESILMVIYDFGPNALLSKTLDKAELFLKKYCNFSCNVKGIC